MYILNLQDFSWKIRLQKFLKNFASENVYIEHETNSYYSTLPEQKFLFKNENAKVYKIVKDTITIIYYGGWPERKELVNGRSKNPLCKITTSYHVIQIIMLGCPFCLDDHFASNKVTIRLNHIKIFLLPNSTGIVQTYDYLNT